MFAIINRSYGGRNLGALQKILHTPIADIWLKDRSVY